MSNRIERERILLAKIEERDRRIVRLERRIKKVLMYAYFIGCAIGVGCGLIISTLL